jgi:hypothetical protein
MTAPVTRHERGVLDTSTVILLPQVTDSTFLPSEPLITAAPLAELSVGPLARCALGVGGCHPRNTPSCFCQERVGVPCACLGPRATATGLAFHEEGRNGRAHSDGRVDRAHRHEAAIVPKPSESR